MLNKVKRIAALSLTFLLLAGLISIAALAQQGVNQPEAPGAGADASGDRLASYEKAAENARLALYVNKNTLGIKVQDKQNGYIWDGTLDEKDDRLNKSWQSLFESGLSVEYMDAKRKISTAPVTGEQAKIAVEPMEDGFSANVNYERLGISLKLEVRLTEDAIEVKVPENSIQETNKDNRLQSLYVYPFFGATKGVQPDKGYMLIPDGSGALISLNEQTLATQPYIGRVFGDDLGMKGSPQLSEGMATPIEQVYLPVFGIAHKEGGNAFVSMITGGAPYAEIRSYPGNVTTAYNWTTAKWIYRENYFQSLDKEGKGINLNQEEKNQFDASMKVMLLSGKQADYSGMANRVQSELVQRGELPAKKDGADPLPLRIEFFAADNQKKLIGSEVIPMTTVDQMDDILTDLRANEVDRMMVVVRGYTEGGATGASPTHFPFEEKVGSGDDWNAFVEKYKALGIPVYFYTDYVMAGATADGYGKGDIAQSVSKQLLSFYDMSYYLQPAASAKLFGNEISSFQKHGIDHIAMDSIGSNLFSTYGKSTSTRSGSIETYTSMLPRDSINSYAFYKPNYYLWRFADRIMDLPMSTSSFLLESEEVPFLQLVLKGHVDYYAQASNFNANPQKEQLKMIDYGSYPSFILTDEDPIKLANTESSWWLFTSQYSVWKDQAVHEYRTVAEALKPVADATFDKREKVREGVFRNTYSNGTVIYVNYTMNEVRADGNKIPAQGFLVREGGRS